MSGAIYALQLLPLSTDSSSSGSILQALYGGGGTSSSPADSLSALTQAEQNQTKDIAQVAAQTDVARDLAAFKAGVASATSPSQLLANPAVLKVLLTANGLGDQVDYTALATQALLSDTSDPTSLANKLPNTAWKSTAETYQFATAGLSVIQQPGVIQTISDAYAEVTWRNSLDAAHPGLSNALTFRAEASTISSIDQILGDPVLRDVVTTSLGLPLEIAFQPLEAQEKAIGDQLDISKFKDPKFTESFIQRYLVEKAGTTDTSSISTPSALFA